MVTESGFHLKEFARKSTTSMALAVENFMLSREAMGCTEQTLSWYRNYLGKILRLFEKQGLERAEAVTPHDIRQMYVQLQQRGLADQTVYNYATVLKAFFNHLEEEELVEKNPIRKVKMPRRSNRILPAFSPEDVHQLLDACRSVRDRAIILAMVDTGCRASEFIALNVGDIDITSGAVTVRQGKGRKDRVTYLGAKARKAVLKYLMARASTHPAEPVWLSYNTGERLTASGLRLMLRRLGKRANVEHCHPHTFRRTCALWSLRGGMNIYALQQIMGHADLTVLRRYLALVEDDLQQAHIQHGAVDNML